MVQQTHNEKTQIIESSIAKNQKKQPREFNYCGGWHNLLLASTISRKSWEKVKLKDDFIRVSLLQTLNNFYIIGTDTIADFIQAFAGSNNNGDSDSDWTVIPANIYLF